MPNIVQNAVGTQRQFTKQPVATYQKQLRGVNSSAGIRDASAADKLAGALNGLGGVINTYFYDREKRKDMEAEDTKRIANQVTDEEWKTLASTELLTKYGDQFHLTDNVLAVSMIEQMRGKYFSDKFNNEYTLLVAKEGRMKTAQEEAERYEKKKQEWVKDNVDVAVNQQEFQKGFWESNPEDVLRNVNAQVEEESRALGAVRDGQLQAQAGSMIAESNGDVTKLKEGFTNLSQSSILTMMPADRRLAFFKDALGQVSRVYGSADAITALGDVVFSVADGQLLKDVIDLEPYKEVAREVNSQYPNQWTMGERTKMLKCTSVEELDKLWAAYSPDEQKTLQKFYHAQRNALEANAIKASQQMVKAAKNAEQTKTGDATVQMYATMYLKGDHTVPAKLSDMGLKGYTAQDAARALTPILYSYTSIQDDKERAKAVMNLLSWEPAAALARSISQQWSYGIHNVTSMSTEDQMNSFGLNTMLNCYSSDPSTFSAIFGKELTGASGAIFNFMNAEGSIEAAVQKFKEAQNNLVDDNFKSKVDSDTKAYLKEGMIKLPDLDTGGEIEIPADNLMLVSMTGDSYKYAIAAGYSDSAARNQIQDSLSDNYASYDNKVYPKALFAPYIGKPDGSDPPIQDGINSSDPMGAFKEWADWVKNNVEGYAPENVELHYNPVNKTIQIRTLDGYRGFREGEMTFPEVWERVNNYIAHKEEAPKKASYEYNDEVAINDKGILAQQEILGN